MKKVEGHMGGKTHSAINLSDTTVQTNSCLENIMGNSPVDMDIGKLW